MNQEKYYIAGEDIQKNNPVSYKDGKVYNLTTEEYNAVMEEQSIVDDLVDYCDLNYLDEVLEIVKDVARHKVEQAIRTLRLEFIHKRNICTIELCQCEMIEYNRAVSRQREKEQEFKKKIYQ